MARLFQRIHERNYLNLLKVIIIIKANIIQMKLRKSFQS